MDVRERMPSSKIDRQTLNIIELTPRSVYSDIFGNTRAGGQNKRHTDRGILKLYVCLLLSKFVVVVVKIYFQNHAAPYMSDA